MAGVIVRRLKAPSLAPSDPVPLVFMCHAAGFCKEMWMPIVDELQTILSTQKPSGTTSSSADCGHIDVVAMDLPGHGDGPVPQFKGWEWPRFLPQEIEKAASEATGLSKDRGMKLAVGHSMGGAGLLMHQLHKPTWDKMVLFEPVIFKTNILSRLMSRSPYNPMSAKAKNRKSTWESIDDAYKFFRSRKAFRQWDDRVVRAYVEGGLRQTDKGVELKCRPEFESQIYHWCENSVWEQLHTLRVPVKLIVGEYTDKESEMEPHPILDLVLKFYETSKPSHSLYEIMEKEIPNCTRMIGTDGGHFWPLEKPSRMAQEIFLALDPALKSKL